MAVIAFVVGVVGAVGGLTAHDVNADQRMIEDGQPAPEDANVPSGDVRLRNDNESGEDELAYGDPVVDPVIVEEGPLSERLLAATNVEAPAGLVLRERKDFLDGSESAMVVYDTPDGGMAAVLVQRVEPGTLTVERINPSGQGYELWSDGVEAVVRDDGRGFPQVVAVSPEGLMVNVMADRPSNNVDAEAFLGVEDLRAWAESVLAGFAPGG